MLEEDDNQDQGYGVIEDLPVHQTMLGLSSDQKLL